MEKTLEEKIVFLLEKVCQSYRNHVWEIAYKEKLTPTQIDIIRIVASHNKLGVSAIAQELTISKATASESIKALIEKGILAAKKSEQDRRKLLINLTPKGKTITKRLQSLNIFTIQALNKLNTKEKKNIYNLLLSLVVELKEKDPLWIVRICPFCANAIHKRSLKCKLRDKHITPLEFQINCPYFIPTSEH